MSVPEENPSGVPKDYLTWNQRWIVIPPEYAEEYVLVRVEDLQRVQKHVNEELSPRHGNFSAAYWSLFSTALAIAATVPALLWTTGLPVWLAAAYIGTSSTLLAIGLVLFFVGRLLGKKHTRAVSDIAEEMHDLGKPIAMKKTPRLSSDESAEE